MKLKKLIVYKLLHKKNKFIQIFGFKTEDECKIYLSKYMKKDNKNNNYIIMGTETIH